MAEKFASEANLCAAFIGSIDQKVWTVYAETADWDILLVRNEDGFQIGVEAKLVLNAEVCVQALERRGWWVWAGEGPDCRAILVPDYAKGRAVAALVDHLAVTVIRMRHPSESIWTLQRFRPALPEPAAIMGRGHDNRFWHELCPVARHKLPDYVPDVAAGASGPTKLTEWKIKAIKIALLVERRGVVTRKDFKKLSIDHRRWVDGGWLVGGAQGFSKGEAFPDFRRQHPEVVAKIEAEYPDWSAKLDAMVL